MHRDADFKQHLDVDIGGFSLHAPGRCGAGDRPALEQLSCRVRVAFGKKKGV